MEVGAAGVVWIDPPPDEVKEYWWNLWYNAKHGPERFRLPGMLGWRRFEMVPDVPAGLTIPDEYKYFTVSDHRDVAVGASQAAQDLVAMNYEESEDPNTGEFIHMEGRWVADTYEPAFGAEYDNPYTEYLLVVGHDVPDHAEEAFDVWCREEYLPALGALPGYVAARNLRPAAGYEHPRHVHRSERTSPTRLTLCDLDTMEAFEAGGIDEPNEPAGVERSKYQLYKRLYPYVGFKHASTLS